MKFFPDKGKYITDDITDKESQNYQPERTNQIKRHNGERIV